MISRVDRAERLIRGNFPFRPRMLAVQLEYRPVTEAKWKFSADESLDSIQPRNHYVLSGIAIARSQKQQGTKIIRPESTENEGITA